VVALTLMAIFAGKWPGTQVAHSTAAWMLAGTDRPEIPPNACCVALYTERSIAARYLECKFKPPPFGSFCQPLD
jgi:hypothetical protein